MSDAVTPTQRAYGLLWRTIEAHPDVYAARRCLYSALTHEQRRDAIEWVISMKGLPSDSEMIAIDIQLGIFPKRSYEPPVRCPGTEDATRADALDPPEETK